MARRNALVARLESKPYRDAFVSELITTGIPFQLRALRHERDWSQKAVGERAGGIAQETICLFENPNYGRLTITTLLRLASAFDVGLMVRFVPFSALVDVATDIPGTLAPVPYERDSGLMPVSDVPTFTVISGGLIGEPHDSANRAPQHGASLEYANRDDAAQPQGVLSTAARAS